MRHKNVRDLTLSLRRDRRPEYKIIEGWGKYSKEPDISICCATYNHADFIEDAICSFLAQECTYSFEVIIRDDASTDGTSDIVERYASQYPNIVRAVINRENLYRKGERPRDAWPRVARGRYIALCEGDDFWISRRKLQQQVTFLEENPDFGLSCHPAMTTFSGLLTHPANLETFANKNGFVFRAEHLLERNFVPTNSVVFKRQFLHSMPKHDLYMGDWPLWVHISSESPAFFHADLLSFYRQHEGGAWTSLRHSEVVRHNIDFYEYIERTMPRLSNEAKLFKRKYIERVSLAHESLLDKVFELKRNPFGFLIKKALSRLSNLRIRDHEF